MDLLSLPQEMLASVSKFVKFDQLLEIRKISSTIDFAARKFHLSRINVDKFNLKTEEGKFHISLTHGDQTIKITHTEESLTTILKFYFSKIRRLNILRFTGMYDNTRFIISKEDAELILNQRSKRLKNLYFIYCELDFDSTYVRKILTTLPITAFCLQLYVTNQEYSPFKDEIFDGLMFTVLVLEPLSHSVTSNITLNRLQAMCSRNLPKYLRLHTNAELNEMGPFLEQVMNDSFDSKNIEWTFNLKVGNMDNEQIRRYIRSLKCLEKYEVHIYTMNIIIRIQVYDVSTEEYSRSSIPFLIICAKP